MKRFLHHYLPATAAVTLVAVALVACQNNGRQDTASTPGDSVSMAAPAADSMAGSAGEALNDAKVADIALTADAIDSAAGKFALEKSKTKAVRDFAQTMVRDHSAVNAKAVALAQKLGVSPEDNDVSKQLKDGADKAHDNVKDLEGAAFDRAYMDREIDYHQAVLDALDGTLIPSAQNAELKQFLTSVRPNFEAHLKRAKAVRQELGGQDSTVAQ